MLRRLRLRLRTLLRRTVVEAELDEELRYHVEKDIERRLARGMSPREARAAVRKEFGDVDVLKEASRDARGMRWLEDFTQDVRFAIRSLDKSRGFAAAAVLTLALGIGMTTAIFSVVHGVLLQQLPFENPDRLVELHTLVNGERSSTNLSPPNFVSLQQEESRSFAAITAYNGASVTLTGAGAPQQLAGSAVGAEFFEVFGGHPLLGRTFSRDDHEPGRHHVVVLSHALWQQQFGRDPGVIGRTIELSGTPHTVVGVMPSSFGDGNDLLWLPQAYEGEFSATSTLGRQRNTWLPVVARLRAGVSVEAARAELRVLGRHLETRFPETNAKTSFTVSPLHEEIVGDARAPLLMLFGAVAFVLFIACANVAGLLLARAAVRREEVAVRIALGARRGRIVRQLITESLVLGGGGGVFGVILAFWATNSFVALWSDALPRFETIGVDGIVLAFAFALAVGASVLAGLLPAFRAAGDGLAATIHSGGRSGLGSQRGRRFRGALMVAQFALAVVLLVGAGLLLESLARLTSVDLGFRTERMLTFRVNLPDATYDSDEQVRTFFDRLMGGIEQQPVVESAGMISFLPIRWGAFTTRFRIEGYTPSGGEDGDALDTRIVSAGYHQTLGVRVLQGRGITEQDRAGGLPIAVINEAAADHFFPGEDPIGRRLFTFSRSWDPLENAADDFTIVGVVADVKSRGLDQQEPQPEVYFAHPQVPLESMFLVVRTAGDPLTVTTLIRRELGALDPNLPVPEFRTLEQVVADSVSQPRFFTTLLSLFSAVALILAAVGIFGLLSFAVAQRTHEIGIRVALGASPRALVANVVRQGLLLVITGIVIGIGSALALTRLLASQLFGVGATNPTTFAAAALVLGAVALFASLIPARRAATVDPLVALRAE